MTVPARAGAAVATSARPHSAAARRVRMMSKRARSRGRYPVRPLMPKMKTHSGAKKRFKLTANGKVRRRHAFSSHILEKKSPKRKRALGLAEDRRQG